MNEPNSGQGHATAKKRKNNDFELADKIRNELFENGILIEDKDDTTSWKYK